MKHMTLHCQTVPELKINLKDVYQCNNCFLGFNTNLELISHLEDVSYYINFSVNIHRKRHKHKSKSEKLTSTPLREVTLVKVMIWSVLRENN